MSIRQFPLSARFILIGATSLWMPEAALAGKPSGGADNVAPAPIASASLSVKTSVRALTLRFIATGDDGTTGTAALYDVFYRDRGSASDSCADNPGLDPDNDSTWTRADRSEVTIPEPAGTVDYFNVRPLESDHDYCLAIRVRDEVLTHWTSWTSIAGRTAADDWPFVAEQ